MRRLIIYTIIYFCISSCSNPVNIDINSPDFDIEIIPEELTINSLDISIVSAYFYPHYEPKRISNKKVYDKIQVEYGGSRLAGTMKVNIINHSQQDSILLLDAYIYTYNSYYPVTIIGLMDIAAWIDGHPDEYAEERIDKNKKRGDQVLFWDGTVRPKENLTVDLRFNDGPFRSSNSTLLIKIKDSKNLSGWIKSKTLPVSVDMR